MAMSSCEDNNGRQQLKVYFEVHIYILQYIIYIFVVMSELIDKSTKKHSSEHAVIIHDCFLHRPGSPLLGNSSIVFFRDVDNP